MSSFGYVYVASLSQAFYRAAVNSAVSLKDFYPEAKATLFTHEKFLKKEDEKFFDKVVTGIPVNKRAKMWGMARTPYDKTLYLDCDTEIRSENIKKVFDIISSDDIMFTRIINHVSNSKRIDDQNSLEYHGGVVLYNSKNDTLKLMQKWYELYNYQSECKWHESIFKDYDPKMQPWDQFTVWYLLHRDPEFKELKHSFFPNGGHEFNYIYLLEDKRNELNAPYWDLEQVVYHYTIPRSSVDAGYIFDKRRPEVDFN